MRNAILLPCDGCGQNASPDHIERRLQRLEWATRFRPLHVQALLLGAACPREDGAFLYDPSGVICGEAQTVLQAVQIATEGKPREAALAEFQKLGLLLTHVLECPLDEDVSPVEAQAILQKRLPAMLTRIRRSLKPKSILLLRAEMQAVSETLRQANLGIPVLPAGSGVFLGGGTAEERELQGFRAALGSARK